MNDLSVQSFGLFAVTLMVTCYALEERGPTYVVLFALGCLLSAIYALLLGSYPFVIAETVWAGVAMRRFRSLKAQNKVWRDPACEQTNEVDRLVRVRL